MAQKTCESCGARGLRKGARMCNDCIDLALEAAEERYYIKGACTYGEHLEELTRINAWAGRTNLTRRR